MGSKADIPIAPHKVFAATFKHLFGEPIPKKDTKDKPKGKKEKCDVENK